MIEIFLFKIINKNIKNKVTLNTMNNIGCLVSTLKPKLKTLRDPRIPMFIMEMKLIKHVITILILINKQSIRLMKKNRKRKRIVEVKERMKVERIDNTTEGVGNEVDSKSKMT